MQYRDELIKYVRKIIGDIPEVEDIVQDTILLGIEKNATLNDKEKNKQWIFRIARNKSIDFIKKKQKISEEISDSEIFENYLNEEKNLLTLAHNNKETYEKARELYLHQNRSAQEVKDFLTGMDSNVSIISVEYIEALLLSEFYQLTQQEIADKLNLPLPTVKSRIQRAKEKAKQVFLKCCDFEFDSRGQIMDYTPRKK